MKAVLQKSSNISLNCCLTSIFSNPPKFRERKDASHISIVGTVSIDGKPLKSMLLSANNKSLIEIQEAL